MNEVKKPRKPLMFYYGVAIVIILLFNLFAMPMLESAMVTEVDLLPGPCPRPAGGPAPARARALGALLLAGLLSRPESPRSAACPPVPLLRLPPPPVPPPVAAVWQCLAGGPRAGRLPRGSPPPS